MKKYSYDEAYNACMKYFDNDELASEITVEKYLLHDNSGKLLERDPDDMHKRLASEFARIESNYPNSMSKDEIYKLFKGFKYIVPQGSPMFGIGNDYVKASLSNCVVIESPKDSISGIFNSAKDMANLFKARCGVGIDISSLRPDGSPVNNSAKYSTGAWSFADFYSTVVNLIGQAGRRGALMLSIDCSHPDIEKFVIMKSDLKKVTGANISIKLSDKFMDAVINDKDFDLEWGGTVYKTIKAKDLFNLIVTTATETGEPGVLFWDRILNDVPLQCYSDVGFNHIGINPCSELVLSSGDSCRLISINLSNFVLGEFSEESIFDFELFESIVRKAVRLSDDLVDLEIEKIEKIIDKENDESVMDLFQKFIKSAIDGRRIGLGTHGLADLLIKMNIEYGSEQSIKFTEELFSVFKNSAYSESAKLAKERGTFGVFDWSKEMDNKFINSLSNETIEEIKKNGRRNGSLLTIAPTGSVSILSRTSSGIEPIFRLKYKRRKKILSGDDKMAGFVDELGVKWEEFDVYHPLAKSYMNKFKVDKIENLPKTFVTSDKVQPENKLKLIGSIQKGIDHQISNTTNLPEGTGSDVVKNVYMKAYEYGLKGVTVYVDGSRSGVLVSSDRNGNFKERSAPKRPSSLDCDIHSTSIDGKMHIVLIGLFDGKPYEIFAGEQTRIKIPRRYIKGKIVKNSYKSILSTYDLVVGEGDDELIVGDIVQQFENPNNLSLCRMTSLSLRHGASPKYVTEQMLKNKSTDFHSFTRGIARILKQYIKDGESAKGMEKECPSCKNNELLYQSGCISCSCGWTKCG